MSSFRVIVCLSLLSVLNIGRVSVSAKEVAKSAPDVGQKVADFDLPIVGGDQMLKLSDQYAEGPVVVIVLRGFPGYQCPLCSRQIGALTNRIKTIAKTAKRVILVYPGPASMLDDHATDFMGSRKLPAPIVMVRDPDMEMVNRWGLRWNAPRETAYPATYVINSDGEVAWRLISDSHGGRSTATDIIKALDKIESTN
ncbi:AhpC/TSA family protein [Rubripirellula lacrimiformis]|uniref:AhpC/TSA family protein n=1 Tax=Rubripirellula lacrimiformis TaxID=1930273 RepID=A0A517N3D1_9BACT|nr:redoxin domain-containing protein [Rubripirellula lacrimiformis]QDT01646.1 AhpC/TSA family protein [Rubripirellula lacrimiformis]